MGRDFAKGGPGADANNMLIAALWPDAFHASMSKKAAELQAYVEMARLVNVAPSFLMVLVGAWAAAGHDLRALLLFKVWVMAAISAGIAVSSVVVNDYFDFRSGVDAVNAPTKPLPMGVVPPDGALLLASGIYMAVLIVACILDVAALRWIIAAAAAVTLLYTPVLKRLTAVKNLAVAFVIAASPLTGALATGLSAAAVARALPATGFLFCGICFREILMDVNDRVGDAAAGVATLPVVFGPSVALAVATGCLLAGACAATVVTAQSGSVLWLARVLHAPMAACQTLVIGGMLGLVGPALADARAIQRAEFEAGVVDAAIGNSFKPIGLGMLFLALLA